MSATPDEANTDQIIGEHTRRREADAHAASARPIARLYMTSDLRAATGLTRTHLDFYLREGLITPVARTESGYLLFGDDELATLRQIVAWRQEGLGLREIRDRLHPRQTPADEGPA
jgi:hypothetical protein